MAKTTETTHADVPAGQDARSAKTFELIPPEQRKLDLRRTDGRAEVTYTLENKKFHPVRGRLEIEPSGATQAEWLTVPGTRNRDFRSREAQDFRVRIAIPPDTPANTFEFTAVGINEANPEEDFTERERSSITIDWEPAPVVKRISKWKLALMILAPLLVLGVGVVLLYRYLNAPLKPLDILDRANRYAQEGDWENYWECWTKQGQHKLVYWLAYEMRKAAEENPRWQGQLQAWLPSFGLTLEDLKEFKQPPRDVRAYQATDLTRAMRRRIEQHGRSSKQFFTTAASWNEYSEESWLEYKENGGTEFSTFEEFQASVLEQFQFSPLCREDLKESMAKQMELYLAVSYADMHEIDKAEFPKRCYLRSDLEDEAVSEVRDDARKTFQKYEDKEEALSVAFQNVNGVWLLNDFYGAGAASPAAKFIGDWIALNGDKIDEVDIRPHKAPDFVTVDLRQDEEGHKLQSTLIGELSAFDSDEPKILNEILLTDTHNLGKRTYAIRSTFLPDLLVLTQLAETVTNLAETRTEIYVWREDAGLRNFFVNGEGDKALKLGVAVECLDNHPHTYEAHTVEATSGNSIDPSDNADREVRRVLVPDDRANADNNEETLLRVLPRGARLPEGLVVLEVGSTVASEDDEKD